MASLREIRQPSGWFLIHMLPAYSPKYLEVKFSEVHCSKLNRPGRGLGTWTGAERRFARNRAHARHDRGEESLQAVATCYAHDFREFLRSGKPRRGKPRRGKHRRRAVKPTSQPTNDPKGTEEKRGRKTARTGSINRTPSGPTSPPDPPLAGLCSC